MNPNPTTAVNPSESSLAALAAWPDDEPICMVNLLAFDGDDGRVAYGRYTAVAARTVAAQGGKAIFLAPVIESTDGWDSVVLVYYPRRAAYLDMQNDPAYVEAIPDRTAGLRARLLYPFALSDMATVPEVTGVGDEVFELELVRLSDPRSEGPVVDSSLELNLAAGGPGLVTDGRWDRLRLRRYPSLDVCRETSNTTAADQTLRLIAQAGVSP